MRTMTITIDLRDLFGPIDTSGDKTVDLSTLASSVSLVAVDDILTIVDVNAIPPRTELIVGTIVGPPDDGDSLEIARNFLEILTTKAGVTDETGAADYDAAVGIEAGPDSFIITITGDFTGLEPDELCYDLDDGSSGSTLDCDTGEIFTVVDNTATLTVAGDDLSNHAVVWGKVSGVVLSSPRVFGVSVDVDAAAGSSQDRTISGNNSEWWQWGLNGAVLTAVYGSFFPGNETKFRFAGIASDPFLCFPEVTPDQTSVVLTIANSGDFGASGEFTVPANGNAHVELSATAGAGAIGPMTTLVSGTQPVRVSVVFTCLTNPANVFGQTLIASPAGVVTVVPME